MSTASISRQLSRWVAGLAYSDIPPEVLDRARGVTLQALSSCLLGCDFPETKQAIRLVEEEEAGCSGATTALVDGRRFSRAGAAFINSEMIFAGGKWDTFRMVVHANCAIVPAALVAAEATRCSGSAFLTGVAAGYEVTDRLAADFVPTILARGFHPGPVFSIFGAAIALAKIMGLDAEQVHGTLAQCVNLAAGNLEGGRSGGRSVREGAAVRNALLAVGLARQGIPGGETVFEGEAGFYFAYAGNKEGRLTHSFAGKRYADFAAITEKLGERWVFLETLYRIYSTAGYNIAHVDVTAALCKRDHIRPPDVERVECVVNWLETQYPSPAFPSRRTDIAPGREQPQYYAAHAILTGGYPVSKNVQQRVGEADPPGIDEMMRRVRLVPSHTQPLFSPRVTIHTRDGIAHTLEATGREFIMSFDELAQRLSPIGVAVPVGERQYAELVAECRQIDQAKDVARLIALTCPPRDRA
ncbi:MAG: MmgE/PrpD family protein [Hyphomicrobiales bacterium]|nr:MmgE/PrpD family protein [Hyphomicrobiales bacterium]MBV9429675.1 MmgE/PrpD family protein [Bradyrhizobiaceae bacterium]